MQGSKRLWLALSGLLSAVLTGIVVRDIIADWRFEGKSLVLTLAENALPLIFAVSIAVAGYLVAEYRDENWQGTVARWQCIGAVGIFVVALEVVGLQLLQGELKPRLIVAQTTIGGAVAGTLVGYANARSADTRRRAERERDKFGALFDNAPAEAVEVLVGDDTVCIEQTNAAFRDLFGVDGTVAGTDLFDVVHHDTDTEASIRDALTSGHSYEETLEAPTDDGRRYFQAQVVPYGDGERAFILYTDVTELRETQAKLEGTVDRLGKSNERLQQFAYVASHDLQEPARMVSSYVSLLEQEYGDQFDETAQEYMDFATDGAERMQDMIDALLDYSRVRTGAEEFTETDANTVFEETMQGLALLIDDHGVTVTHDDLPDVEADRNQLGQLFQNLVENAIEYGGDEVHVGAEHRNGGVVFSVADDGEGIPESRQDRIFEIFEQSDRDSDGTGMGLAICDRIVSRHGGKLWVESEHGEGTTFYVSLPASQ